ncbi:MAG: serine hydrolase [Actinomycetota bacterium]
MAGAAVMIPAGAATPAGATAAPIALRPVPGEAFFGQVVAVAPASALQATVSSRGAIATVPVAGGMARAEVSGPVGPRGVTVVLRGEGNHVVARRSSAGAFLLPRSGQVAKPGARRDRALEAALGRIAASHPGVNAMWVQKLWNGHAAGWNADAEFPAASLVKLPLAVGAVMRMGSRPWLNAAWPDVVEVLRRSDDKAANRLVDSVGSGCGSGPDAAAADGLRRLGARQSTYPGCYLVEDELQPRLPAGGVTSTPTWSTRHTTARDMGRMLFALQSAAVPTPSGRRQTGIDPLRARRVLGLLLTADQVGANASLFTGGLPDGIPVAEKNGWRNQEQHGAAIAYTRKGPIIMVVLTQRAGQADLADARAIGADVARAAVRG